MENRLAMPFDGTKKIFYKFIFIQVDNYKILLWN